MRTDSIRQAVAGGIRTAVSNLDLAQSVHIPVLRVRLQQGQGVGAIEQAIRQAFTRVIGDGR